MMHLVLVNSQVLRHVNIRIGVLQEEGRVCDLAEAISQ